MPAQTVIQVRRDTAANWSSANPTLAAGEMGYDSTNKLFKIGDGSTAWNSLGTMGTQGAEGPYAVSSTATTLVNSTTDTSVMSISISGAKAGDIYRVTAWGDRNQSTGGNVNYTHKIKLGGTTLLTSPTVTVVSNARAEWQLDILLYCVALNSHHITATYSTNNQGTADTWPNIAGAQAFTGNTTSTVDLTTAQNLELFVQMGTASANADFVTRGYVVTRVR